MYSLGLNLSHDKSACIIGPNNQVVAIAEERLDKNKHSCTQDSWGRWFTLIPTLSINYCLETLGITINDLDVVTACNAVVIDGGVLRNLNVTDIVWQFPWNPKTKIVTINHHLAHAYSAFTPSGFDQAAVVVMDKGGSIVDEVNAFKKNKYPILERATLYSADANGIHIVEKIKDRKTAPLINSNSIGALYEQATTYLGYSPFDSGKTMGLAPFGDSRHIKPMSRFLSLNDNGYELDFIVQSIGQSLIPNQFSRIFGFPSNCPQEPSENDKAVAKAAQEIIEETVYHLSKLAVEKTGIKKVCLSGGIALNSVANYKIKKSNIAKELWIQPASSDDGTAIGASIYGFTRELGQELKLPSDQTMFGKHYSELDISSTILNHSLLNKSFSVDTCSRLEEVASLIAKGKIVGWFNGKSEFGPRALGRRSILANPSIKNMKEALNLRIKKRENYRPYGASVLIEKVQDYFDCDFDTPFMLFVVPIRKDKKEQISAVTHIDNTCRIQTVSEERDGEYYRLIVEFERMTGLPIILNTSFNVNGQPIIETPLDAINSFLAMDLDALYLQGFLIKKMN